MSDIGQIERLLTGCTLAGPADEEMIATAQAQLGVQFPRSYKAFLARFGAALCSGFEIAGLFRHANNDETPLWSNVVAKTQMRRRAGIPKQYVAISDNGGDFTFYIDTNRFDTAFECPIIVFGPGADGRIVADNFVDFLAQALNGRLPAC